MTAEPEQESAAAGPLAGLRVIDASTILAGPLAAQILGDFGAEVIKVEHPRHGDGMRGHGFAKDGVPLWWKMIGRNKRTIGIKLSDPDGAALFRDLAATADVIVENFRPGTLERWGLGYDLLSAKNKGLILVRVTGFGQEGPYRDRVAFGTLIEAMSGFAHLTGEPEGPPTLPPFGLADSVGGLAAVNAAVMALYERDARSGLGQVIDLALLEPMMAAVGPSVIYYDQLGIDQVRTGNRSQNNAPRNTYRTSDHKWVAISTSANSIAARVMTLVGHPEVIVEPWFATGGSRAEHADELDAMVGDWIAVRSSEEVVAAFAEAGAAVAPVYSPSELLADPQVIDRDMITEVPDPELGSLRMHNLMWRMSRTPGAIRFTGRPPGADTARILTELGLTELNQQDLRDRGVIA